MAVKGVDAKARLLGDCLAANPGLAVHPRAALLTSLCFRLIIASASQRLWEDEVTEYN